MLLAFLSAFYELRLNTVVMPPCARVFFCGFVFVNNCIRTTLLMNDASSFPDTDSMMDGAHYYPIPVSIYGLN